MSELAFVLGAIGLFGGGLLKGATGAGAPLLVVPLIAMLYDVPFAVALTTFPGLLANIWQGWRYRKDQKDPVFVWTFAGSAAVGAAFGSVLLVSLPPRLLLIAVGLAVWIYITFRLLRPQWVLGYAVAKSIALPAGLVGGLLQGASGISAPISLTYLNAMRMERARFIATVSVFFAAMSVVQIPSLFALGVLTWDRMLLSLAACLPLFGAMPVGAWLARHLTRETFDKVMLVVLAAISTKILAEAFLG